MEISSATIEIKNRVARELSWAVVGCLSAAVGFKNRVRHGDAEAGLIAGAADGVNGIMLKKDEGLLAASRKEIFQKAALKIQCGGVVHPAGSKDFHSRCTCPPCKAEGGD